MSVQRYWMQHCWPRFNAIGWVILADVERYCIGFGCFKYFYMNGLILLLERQCYSGAHYILLFKVLEKVSFHAKVIRLQYRHADASGIYDGRVKTKQ